MIGFFDRSFFHLFMHIADGILSNEVCLGAAVISAAAVGYSLRQLNQTVALRTIPLTGMLAAVIFAGQMVKFPLILAPAYGHLLGGVLASIVVGPWGGCVAMALVLFLQMALFADGGWLAYGANVLNMGVVGSLGGHAIYNLVRRLIPGSRGILVGTIVASWLSVVAGSALFCLEFSLSHGGESFQLGELFAVMTTLHSLVGIGEALISGGIIAYLLAARPELLVPASPIPGLLAGTGRVVWVGVIFGLIIAAFVAPFAADGSDALETAAEKLQFDALEVERSAPIAGYELHLPGVDANHFFWHRLAISLAGVTGTIAVFAISVVLDRLLQGRLVGQASEVRDAE
jgi:cobalt/nickel transport system permease protein